MVDRPSSDTFAHVGRCPFGYVHHHMNHIICGHRWSTWDKIPNVPGVFIPLSGTTPHCMDSDGVHPQCILLSHPCIY